VKSESEFDEEQSGGLEGGLIDQGAGDAVLAVEPESVEVKGSLLGDEDAVPLATDGQSEENIQEEVSENVSEEGTSEE